MSYSDDMDALPVFYIGQHESKRALDVSAELVQHAQDLGVCHSCFEPSFVRRVADTPSMTCSRAPSPTTTSTPAC